MRLCPPGGLADPAAGVPTGVEVLEDMVPWCEVWRASVCKHTAHLAALQHVRQGLDARPPLMSNIDCHSLLTQQWLAEVFDGLCGARVMPVAVPGKGIAAVAPAARNGVFGTGSNDADCTGRVALQGDVFLMLRGYGEVNFFGTGYEDIDLCPRLAASSKNPTHVPTSKPSTGAAAVPAPCSFLSPEGLKRRQQVGLAIRNSGASVKEDRGSGVPVGVPV